MATPTSKEREEMARQLVDSHAFLSDIIALCILDNLTKEVITEGYESLSDFLISEDFKTVGAYIKSATNELR